MFKLYLIGSKQINKFYIGTTDIELSDQLKKYKINYNQYKENQLVDFLPYMHILQYADAYIHLIEKNDDKLRLDWREIELLKANYNNVVNTYIPKKVSAQYFYYSNKEVKKIRAAKYYEMHKDIIQQQTKEYRNNNKQQIKEQKQKIITCACGCKIAHGGKAKHMRTQKHKTKMMSV